MEPLSAIHLPVMLMGDEIPGAVGGVDKVFDKTGYEPLHDSGNIYNTLDGLDEAPRPPSRGMRPPPTIKPAIKPKPRASLDD